MKSIKKIFLLGLLTIMALSLVACSTGNSSTNQSNESTKSESKQIVIGATLPIFSDKWQTYVIAAMKTYEKEHPNIKVIFADAQNDSSKQMSQVENFIVQKVDGIFLFPVDPTGADAIVKKASAAKIPLVAINRRFNAVDQGEVYYVGSDEIQAGIMEMEAVAKLLNGKGNIVIMNGQLGQDPTIKRTQGYKDVLKKYPDIKIIREKTADWDREKATSLMENWLQSGETIDAVLANNDEMAIGAFKAIEAAGKSDKIIVAGVDATPDALKYVKDGKMKVTVFQDAVGQGQGGLDKLVKLINGQSEEKVTLVPFQLVTKDNVEEFIKKASGN